MLQGTASGMDIFDDFSLPCRFCFLLRRIHPWRRREPIAPTVWISAVRDEKFQVGVVIRSLPAGRRAYAMSFFEGSWHGRLGSEVSCEVRDRLLYGTGMRFDKPMYPTIFSILEILDEHFETDMFS
jgi:hypothetical protein